MKNFLTALFILLLLPGPAEAQRSKPDTLTAFRTDEKITLDGILNENSWRTAVPIENFTQREQNEGAPPTEKTTVSVLYNTNEIYFGIRCFDSEPKKISAQQMSRDFDWGSDDDFEIMLSPFNDNRNGYLFVINPNGAMADVWLGDEGHDFNFDWNGIWDAKVTRDDKGWYAEVKIPFSTLKFKGESIQVWGLNFERNIRRKKEQLLWQAWSRIHGVEKISQSGKLIGLENIKQKERVEIIPFVTAGIQSGVAGTEKRSEIGGEVNFDITPTLKLNLTANTDFAQVESDRREVNLSRFSLFYPEKRQFFLEGKSYFDMQVSKATLFYSRRIGIDSGKEIPVLGGVRLFGKLNRTSIGLLSLQTGASGDIHSANSSVLRVKQDILDQSGIGFITTQKFSKDGYNALYGTDFTYSTSKFAGDRNLMLGFSGAVSIDKKNNTLLHKDKNSTYHFFVYYPNDVWELFAGMNSIQENFNPGLGFINRSNYKRIYGELGYNPRYKKMPGYVRNFAFKPFAFEYYLNDKTNVTETFRYTWSPFGVNFKNGDSFEFAVSHMLDNPAESFDLIESVTIPAGRYWDSGFALEYSTFEGRRVSGEIEFSSGKFYTGYMTGFEMELNLNLNRHLNIGLDLRQNFLEIPEGKFNVSEIGGRVEFALNTRLNTSLFAQWNSEDNQMLLNYRINWIPKIGSFFYFVVNQNVDTSNNTLKLTNTTILAKLVWRFAI